MEVLVLGGTGAIGSHLVEVLASNKHDICVTSRKDRINKQNVTYVKGNALDIKFIEPILKEKKWDAVIDFMIYDSDQFKSRVGIILESTLQYIFISSARVYADSENPISENSLRLLDTVNDQEYLCTDEYALLKAREEDVLINAKTKNWTIIRPYITYSEKRLQLGVFEKEDWLYRTLNGRSIVLPDDIMEKETTLTYGFDVSNIISKIVGCDTCLGEIYNLTTPQSIKWKDIFNLYVDCIEEFTGEKVKVEFCDIVDLTKIQGSRYQIEYDRLYNRIFDVSKMEGLISIGSLEQVQIRLKSCLVSFLENQEFLKINWRSEALKDKFTKEFTPLKEIIGIKQKVKYLFFRFFSN